MSQIGRNFNLNVVKHPPPPLLWSAIHKGKKKVEGPSEEAQQYIIKIQQTVNVVPQRVGGVPTNK